MTQLSGHLAALQENPRNKLLSFFFLEREARSAVLNGIQSRKQKGMKNVHNLKQPIDNLEQDKSKNYLAISKKSSFETQNYQF